MSKKPKDITRGLLYLGRGEYSRVIRLLEAKIPLYVENREFYTILAKAFFYTGDFVGAKLYFDRGQKIYWDIQSALYLAVLGLKRRDFNSSLRIWLDILDEDPKNRMAKKGLATLKKYSTIDELDYFIHSKKVDSLIPMRIIRLTSGTLVSICLVSIILFATIFLLKTDYLHGFISSFSNPTYDDRDINRDGIEEFELGSMNNDYLDFSEQSVYSFSGSQIEEFFTIASELFSNNKDNRVKSYLNLIKYSNANENIKKKAELLESYLQEPNWSDDSDDITFNNVNENFYQYDGCIVKWKGKISNLDIKDKKIHFSFLVGYDSGKVLEGVVPVEFNENVKIQENQPIEVLGRVVLRDDSFYLEALTVMQYVIRN